MEKVDLVRLFYALRSKILVMITVGLLFACGAAGYTKFFISPTYTSTSTILVLTKETTLTSLADLQLGSQLTQDYTVLINSRPVLEEVIENLGLQMNYKALRNNISIVNPSGTRILTLSAVHNDAKMSKAIVDELAKVASAYISEKMEVLPPKIIEEGELPVYKSGPNMKKNVAVGFFLGIMLVAGIIVVFETLNDSIQNEDDIVRYLNMPVLAVVPDKGLERGKRGKKKKKSKQGKAI